MGLTAQLPPPPPRLTTHLLWLSLVLSRLQQFRDWNETLTLQCSTHTVLSGVAMNVFYSQLSFSFLFTGTFLLLLI